MPLTLRKPKPCPRGLDHVFNTAVDDWWNEEADPADYWKDADGRARAAIARMLELLEEAFNRMPREMLLGIRDRNRGDQYLRELIDRHLARRWWESDGPSKEGLDPDTGR